MLPSQYADNLFEVGDVILARQAKLKEQHAARALIIAQADVALAEIAIAEQAFERAIRKQWTDSEIETAKSLTARGVK